MDNRSIKNRRDGQLKAKTKNRAKPSEPCSNTRITVLRLRLVVFCLTPCFFLTLPAIAQDEYCGDPSDETYVGLMNAAGVAIEAEDYDTALANFMLAYRSFQPGILEFALARTYHHLARYDEAIDHYNRFLRHYDQCPDSEALIETAEEYRNLAVREQTAATDIPRQPVEPTSAIHPGVWVTCAGGALILSGVIWDLAKMGIDDDIAAAYEANDTAAAENLLEDRDTAAIVDWVLYGGGTAIVLTGVILMLVLDTDESDSFAVGAQPVQHGWVLSFEGRF